MRDWMLILTVLGAMVLALFAGGTLARDKTKWVAISSTPVQENQEATQAKPAHKNQDVAQSKSKYMGRGY